MKKIVKNKDLLKRIKASKRLTWKNRYWKIFWQNNARKRLIVKRSFKNRRKRKKRGRRAKRARKSRLNKQKNKQIFD